MRPTGSIYRVYRMHCDGIARIKKLVGGDDGDDDDDGDDGDGGGDDGEDDILSPPKGFLLSQHAYFV